MLAQGAPQDRRVRRPGGGRKPAVEIDTLKEQEINLISLEEDIDTSATGEPVFHVFGVIAHFERRLIQQRVERRLISERTKDGLRAARKRGHSPGRPPLHADTVSALQELVTR